MLELVDVRHSYGGNTVVSMDSFQLKPRSVTALVGPNGCGKSTLLRILALVEAPERGTVRYGGRDLIRERQRRALRGTITLVEQRPFLFAGTVSSNLQYALRLGRTDGIEPKARAAAALEKLHVSHLAGRPSGELSEGERQIVAVARAMVLQPEVLLLDEPTSAADTSAVQRIMTGLEAERERGATVFFVSHQIEEAFRWSDDVFSMHDGTITQAAPENLFRCHIPESGAEYRTIRVGPLHLHVVTDRTGTRTVAIPPEDIVVSMTELESSARNQFRGRVVRISERGNNVVSLVVDAGIDLTVRITKSSLAQFGINVGTELVLSVKATAIHVY